jgi:transcription antitermination factor NusG
MGTQVSVSYEEAVGMPILARPAWFAVHTSCRHEKQVAMQFAGRGIDYLLPLYKEIHQWGDRRIAVDLPLFPGYLFARVLWARRMDVLRVPGVARIVGFNGAPMPLDDAEIAGLQAGIASGIRLEPHPFLKSGCRVRIRSGVLRGLEGILVRKKDADRIVISVDLIMKSVALEIDAANLEVIS